MSQRIASLADYCKQRDSFRWDRPEHFNFGFDVVDAQAASHPTATAIHWVGPDGERIVTFAELAERSQRVAVALANLGLQRGERVLVLLPRVVPWWEMMVGILKAGMVAVPGTTLLTADDIAYRVSAGQAAVVVTDAAGAEKVEQAAGELTHLKHKILVGPPPEEDTLARGWLAYDDLLDASTTNDSTPRPTRSDEPALIFFTSGTTGLPKMVLHTQASYGLAHRVTGQYWLDLDQDDLHWNISDTGWAKAAWSSLFGPWNCGAALFVHHTPDRFDPADVLRCLAEYPITTLCAAPTIYRMVVQQDLSSLRTRALRHCVAAGEPLNPQVIEAWQQATGVTIRDGYGQTETVLLCGNFPGIDVKPGSMGFPTPGFDLAVIDEAGNRLLPGQEGDIAVRIEPDRPLGLFQEYWRDPEATAAACHHGWYVTGDRAVVDEDGYFWFVARADDVITSSAYRIGPFEVESALVSHPAVVEAAVVGKPDPLRGQVVHAYVVLASGIAGTDQLKTELQEHVKRRTAPYKYPREIEFAAELPKTVSGKIRRAELRERSG